MSRTLLIPALAALLILPLAAGCGGEKAPESQAQAMPEGQAAPSAEAPVGVVGKVLETFDSGGYTYVRVEALGKEIWAAGPESEVAVGAEVFLPQGMLMREFKSSSLDRVFDEIWFVPAILPPEEAEPHDHDAAEHGAEATTVNPGTAGHPEVVVDAAGVDFAGLAKPDGGMTVAEIHAAKGTLSGKEVLLRAKVVKFTGNVMGRNWIHLRDGSGEGATADLTATTDAVARVGDTVLVRGVMAEDKDFGYGYNYALLIEEAQVTVE